MQYVVSARPRLVDLPKLWKLLNDGTISRQEPDGREIVASMKRAVFDGDTVQWNETCYCNPPLKHERSTVYDQFFTDMRIESPAKLPRLEGQRFWDYLRNNTTSGYDTGIGDSTNSGIRYVPIRAL